MEPWLLIELLMLLQLTKLVNIYIFRLLYHLSISTMSFYIRIFVQLVRFIHIYGLRVL